jgi:hypothetical protein
MIGRNISFVTTLEQRGSLHTHGKTPESNEKLNKTISEDIPSVSVAFCASNTYLRGLRGKATNYELLYKLIQNFF